MADPARPAVPFVLGLCVCMRRRTICVEAIDGFRVAVLRYVRERMTAAYGDAAGERLREVFGRKEWRELEAKVSARKVHVDTHPADTFDMIDVNQFRGVFEKYHDVLLPPQPGASPRESKEQRRVLLDLFRDISGVRNACAHPSQEDLSDWDAVRTLDTLRRGLRMLGLDDEATRVEALRGQLLPEASSPKELVEPRAWRSSVRRLGRPRPMLVLASFAAGAAVIAGTVLWLAKHGPTGATPETGAHEFVASDPEASIRAEATPADGPHVPYPFSAIRMGMSSAQLQQAFPPVEDVSKCSLRLVGDLGRVSAKSSSEATPHARCPTIDDLAGVGPRGRAGLERALGSSKGFAAPDLERTAILALAQIRASLLAGQIDASPVAEAADGLPAATASQLTALAALLAQGASKFVQLRSTRRSLCAVLREDCGHLDAVAVRKYVDGGFSLSELDAEAHRRVAFGPCRGLFLGAEERFRAEFARRTGALGPIGLARSARKDRRLDPADPSTFQILVTQTGLPPAAAQVAVRVANALQSTDDYFRGCIAVLAPFCGEEHCVALAWLREGIVVRVAVYFRQLDGGVPVAERLRVMYGLSATAIGPLLTWRLADGSTARLDTGPAEVLVVERAAM